MYLASNEIQTITVKNITLQGRSLIGPSERLVHSKRSNDHPESYRIFLSTNIQTCRNCKEHNASQCIKIPQTIPNTSTQMETTEPEIENQQTSNIQSIAPEISKLKN